MILKRAQRRHEVLEHAAQSRLRALVEDQLAERHDNLAAMDRRRLEKLAAAPEGWLVTDVFQENFEQWRQDVASGFGALYADLGSGLDARVASTAFVKAFGDGIGLESMLRDGAKALNPLLTRGASELGEHGGKFAADVLARLPRLAPYAEQFGKVAGRAVTATVGLAIEALAQALEGRAAAGHRRELEKTLTVLRNAGETWVDQTIAGSDANQGILHEVLSVKQRLIAEPLVSAHEADDALTETIGLDEAMLTRAQELITEADIALAG